MKGTSPNIGVLRFPGSNDDRDAEKALRKLGASVHAVWHAENHLPDVKAVVLPGGFSYGDYLRCGAIARLAPVMKAVSRFAEEGGLVLGICNGFQILCESGLLPGALRRNKSLRFVCKDTPLNITRTDSPFTKRCKDGERLVIPIKHGEGSYFAPPELLTELELNNQIVLRYAEGSNPNGSIANIAGITNKRGNVMGLMPHPEHAVDTTLGTTDGAAILGALIDAA